MKKIFPKIIFGMGIIICTYSCSKKLCINDTLNKTDDKYLKQGIWLIKIDSISQFEFVCFKNDLLNGKYLRYYENGKIAVIGEYKNGVKNGTWHYYLSTGGIMGTDIYKNGKIKKRIISNANW